MAEMASLRATVHGHVQGVFFRVFVLDRAAQLHLTGYVCNLPGGVVEVVAEGDKPDLEKLVAYLRKGPPGASVDAVDTEWAAGTGNYRDFKVRY
ncbi:MAG: acylphosphatase [Dehalococcoidales bacterium]|jgi:acylphosphatase